MPVITTGVEGHFPAGILAVLTSKRPLTEAVIEAAVNTVDKKPVVFLYIGMEKSEEQPELYRMLEPHLNDEQARLAFGRAHHLAQEAEVPCRFVYRGDEPEAVYHLWETLHPYDTIVTPEQAADLKHIKADYVRDEITPHGRIMHLLKEYTSTK